MSALLNPPLAGLFLWESVVSGTLPRQWGSMTTLDSLIIRDLAWLSGTLPDSWGWDEDGRALSAIGKSGRAMGDRSLRDAVAARGGGGMGWSGAGRR